MKIIKSIILIFIIIAIVIFLFYPIPDTAFISFDGNTYDGIKMSIMQFEAYRGVDEIAIYFKEVAKPLNKISLDLISSDSKFFINNQEFEIDTYRGSIIPLNILLTNETTGANIKFELNDEGQEYVKKNNIKPEYCICIGCGYEEKPFEFSNYVETDGSNQTSYFFENTGPLYWTRSEYYDIIISFNSSAEITLKDKEISISSGDLIRLRNVRVSIYNGEYFWLKRSAKDYFFDLSGIEKCKISSASGSLILAITAKGIEYTPSRQNIEIYSEYENYDMKATLSAHEGNSSAFSIGGTANTVLISDDNIFPHLQNFQSWLYDNRPYIVLSSIGAMIPLILSFLLEGKKEKENDKKE